MNPWHDLALGSDITREFRCVIEIPKGSKIKYEMDKATGLLWLDRVLHSAVHYPANYGFLPQTYGDDGRLVHHDAFAANVHEGVGSAQIDGEIVREQPGKQAEQHRRSYPLCKGFVTLPLYSI